MSKFFKALKQAGQERALLEQDQRQPSEPAPTRPAVQQVRAQ
jgi:hypothetical protein